MSTQLKQKNINMIWGITGAEADLGKNIICFPDLKKLIMEDWKSYIKAGGHYGPYQAENKNVINVLSEVKDHLPMLQELVCSRDHFSESGAIHGAGDRLQESILCEFQPYGDVMTLGKYGDPCLILVKINGWMDTAPPLYIKDKYERTFELQFLLLWRNQGLIKHMVVHCNLVDRWVLDDNSQSVAPHNVFRFDTACYVNITQPGPSNVGAPVAEEGLRPGASVWNWSPVGNGNQVM
ncbi:hypothetical protein SRHO_G00073640 [Serrasalmus rhombeus]